MIDNSVQSRDNNDHEIQSDNEEEEKANLIKQNLDGSFGATPIAAPGNNSSSDQESNIETAETGNVKKRGFFSNPASDFVKKLYENYDSTFITMLAAQYVN